MMLCLTTRNMLLGTCAAAALTLAASGGASAQPTTIVYGGGSTLAAKIYGTMFSNLTSQFDPTTGYSYAAVGSGQGTRAVLCNDGSQAVNPATNTNAPDVHFGATDNPLTQTQIADWNNSSNKQTGGGSSCVGGVAAGAGQGKAQGGQLIQIPTIGTPVTIPVHAGNPSVNGSLTFTDAQLCGIFSGQITSWTDSKLSGVYSGSSRYRPSGNITVVYRSDGSGTSALLTSHLNAVCSPSQTGGVSFPAGGTQTFTTVFGSVPSGFVGASGSGGVASAIAANAGSVGYISPDYTQVPSQNSGNSSFPVVAAVVNGTTHAALLPTVPNTVAALNEASLANINPADGTTFVPTIPNPPVGYPIVGYTTIVLPTCYASNNVANGIYNFYSEITGDSAYLNSVEAQGFTPLPQALLDVINSNIWNPGSASPPIDVQDGAAGCVQGGGTTYAGR